MVKTNKTKESDSKSNNEIKKEKKKKDKKERPKSTFYSDDTDSNVETNVISSSHSSNTEDNNTTTVSSLKEAPIQISCNNAETDNSEQENTDFYELHTRKVEDHWYMISYNEDLEISDDDEDGYDEVDDASAIAKQKVSSIQEIPKEILSGILNSELDHVDVESKSDTKLTFEDTINEFRK
ncbi:unnamed protein product, partial [Meganyctiphanes norvegica]